jgi:hypothetical protein
LMIVTDDIAHENVDHVIVDRDGLAESHRTRAGYWLIAIRAGKDSRSAVVKVATIPIKGQHFLLRRPPRFWTQVRRAI